MFMAKFHFKFSQKLNWVQDEVVGMDINENGNMSERSSSSSGVAEDDGSC